MKPPKTLQEAIVYFADSQRAFDYAVSLRWPDGKVHCPRCSSESNYFIKTRKLWLCRGCNRQFTVKVNTIFEDSAIGLDKWMTAFWMLVNCKNGVSSMEIHRTIGVTQKTAWFMLQRLRAALHNRTFGSRTKVGGPDTEVEVDETFVGGKVKNMHRSRRERFAAQEGFTGAATGKTIVQGILDRNLREVRATVVPNVRRETLQSEILKQVKYGTKVYTDDAIDLPPIFSPGIMRLSPVSGSPTLHLQSHSHQRKKRLRPAEPCERSRTKPRSSGQTPLV